MTWLSPRWVAPVVDLVVGLALAAAAAANAAGDFPDAPLAGVAMAVAGLAQVLRRVRPVTAFTVSFGLMMAVALVFGHYESGGSVLIGIVATYSVMVYGSNLPYVVATLIAFAAVLNLPGQSVDEAVGDLVFTALLLGLVGGSGLVVRRFRDRSRASAAREAELMAEQARAAEAAAAEERRRIQRELHDILAHSLGVIALQTGAAEQALGLDSQRARKAISAARETAQGAMAEVHTLLRVIKADANAGRQREPTPDLDRLPALAEQAAAAGFPVDLTIEGEPVPIPAAIQTSLYRVVQEGLANALKHSGTNSCTVVLRYLPDAVEVEVLDRGIGRMQGPGTRAGLVGIQERANLFGGQVQAGPRPDGGWSLRVAIPVST